jgi:hypothetical protein
LRKYLIAALAGAIVLALAGVAWAVQQQSADIKFSQKKTSSSTSIDSTFKVSDPDNHTAGQEGKPTKQINRVDIIFPKGITFSPKALPQCDRNTAAEILRLCPKKSHLADGTTKIDGRGGALGGIVSAKLHAYNAPNGLRIVVSSSNPLADNQVLAPTLKKNVLSTQLPDALSIPGVDAYLTDFHLFIPKRTGKLKGKKVPYAKTPKTCPKNKKWVVKVKYFFKSGGTFTTPGTVNKCTPPKKKHKKKK